MNIENNTILIVPNKLKKEVLKKIKKLINFKIISLEEFIKNYYFDYDNKHQKERKRILQIHRARE